MARAKTLPNDDRLADQIKRLNRRKNQAQAATKHKRAVRQRRARAGLKNKESGMTPAMCNFFSAWDFVLKNADEAYEGVLLKDPSLKDKAYYQDLVAFLARKHALDATFEALTLRLEQALPPQFFHRNTKDVLMRRKKSRLDQVAASIAGKRP